MAADQRRRFEGLAETLKQRGLDGWLLYDFQRVNPIVRRVLEIQGMLTRRLFVWLPAVGPARVLVHGIDRGSIGAFEGEVEVYSTWQDLHQRLASTVRGRRIAMETSPENAVPYLDRVPAGLTDLLSRLGASIVSSAPLVTQFAARWSPQELEDHRAAATALAEIARTTLARVVRQVGRAREYDVQQHVLEAMAARGLETEDPPVVAFGANAANPHYAARPGSDAVLEAGHVVLLDLWARRSARTVWADQTWMAYAGAVVPEEVVRVWDAVVTARDAVVQRLRSATGAGERLTGADLDQVARGVIRERGFADAFVHRTGHSIEIDIHGSGPHLDDFETHDVRELLPGIGFSIEPGVYLPGRFGVRSEINVVLGRDGPEVTPAKPQTEMIVSG